ncbi:MAG: HpcH/HpaI aldolase/citrate lyase family protein [Melioribacteraceae bacterium]|nr:HpcH/HpaI aldolase/citrate lyase family protein [Melioribacteraceae bacterium]
MAEKLIASAGNNIEGTRSDCFITIELMQSGGIKLNISSKVASLFENSIKSQILDFCKFYKIKSANISIDDFGALPFTISARLEAAYRKIMHDPIEAYLPGPNLPKIIATDKNRLRRSRLYLPGNEPKFFPNASLHKPDGIILDLEDSVHPANKESARILVRNALRFLDFSPSERMVRINQGELGLEDLEQIIPQNVNLILIPKCESGEDLKLVAAKIDSICEDKKLKHKPWLMPIIESALGIENAYEIATASNLVCALAIGLEDYTADIGVERTKEGNESLYARLALVNAAKASKVQAIDTVFSDVNDMDGLQKSVFEAKSIGFEGKGCIHPRQIPIVNRAFLPNEKEIEKAKQIAIAFEAAEKKGLGVVALGSKMIDPPVVKRALKIVKLAEENQLIEKSWRNES